MQIDYNPIGWIEFQDSSSTIPSNSIQLRFNSVQVMSIQLQFTLDFTSTQCHYNVMPFNFIFMSIQISYSSRRHNPNQMDTNAFHFNHSSTPSESIAIQCKSFQLQFNAIKFNSIQLRLKSHQSVTLQLAPIISNSMHLQFESITHQFDSVQINHKANRFDCK